MKPVKGRKTKGAKREKNTTQITESHRLQFRSIALRCLYACIFWVASRDTRLARVRSLFFTSFHSPFFSLVVPPSLRLCCRDNPYVAMVFSYISKCAQFLQHHSTLHRIKLAIINLRVEVRWHFIFLSLLSIFVVCDFHLLFDVMLRLEFRLKAQRCWNLVCVVFVINLPDTFNKCNICAINETSPSPVLC